MKGTAPSVLAPWSRRQWLAMLGGTLAFAPRLAAQDTKKSRTKIQVTTAPPTKPPLQPVELARLPDGQTGLDLFLLLGQSNMKGRGQMPEEPSRDSRIVMMHLRDDAWYVARHPLHLTGDAQTFRGADNAGVGPGLAFAEALLSRAPERRVGLIPGAVGGTSIMLWQKGERLYAQAVRRAHQALTASRLVSGRIRAVLWLQGEGDTPEARLAHYEARLHQLVRDLRADLAEPALPFIACTIGEMTPEDGPGRKGDINRILLALPGKVPHTACVDARGLKTNIGDRVHFDTAAQNEIGRRFAAEYHALTTK
jgi:hypothetical protein